MGRKFKYIEKLTEEQKSSLKKGYQTGKSHLFRRKCQCILLSDEQKTTPELAEFYAVSQQSIRAWFKLWETQGINGLKLKPGRGRKPKLRLDNPQQVQTVKTLVENEPKNLNRVTIQIKFHYRTLFYSVLIKQFFEKEKTILIELLIQYSVNLLPRVKIDKSILPFLVTFEIKGDCCSFSPSLNSNM